MDLEKREKSQNEYIGITFNPHKHHHDDDDVDEMSRQAQFRLEGEWVGKQRRVNLCLISGLTNGLILPRFN